MKNDREDLGSCCACGRTDAEIGGYGVRNILMLPLRAPVPGKGWGCVACGLPFDGASVVLCDECLNANAEYKYVVSGYPKDNVRVPRESVCEPFEHNKSKHPELLTLAAILDTIAF